ncbi:MAG: 50S ribosomal protein L4 [Verrucomicrobiota bacterium]|nr:50S ribosomal protein L4 [Verrucomicrobiota bacterium]
MKFKIFKSDGSSSTEKDIKEFPTLDAEKGVDALRQVIIAVHANNRQGNASTKLRSEVSGSGKKIFKQKGLGVGRAGDKRAIQRRGGGVIFGPRPRSYNQKVNRKVKRLALTRALIDQADSNQICLIEKWEISEAKTKLLNGVIQSIAPKSKKVLVVGDEFSENVGLAARNLPNAKLSFAQDVSPLEIVQADMIIFCENGMNKLIEKISEKNKS